MAWKRGHLEGGEGHSYIKVVDALLFNKALATISAPVFSAFLKLKCRSCFSRS
jgi:hypothetical protein